MTTRVDPYRVRALIAEGRSQTDVATLMGVSRQRINQVLKRPLIEEQRAADENERIAYAAGVDLPILRRLIERQDWLNAASVARGMAAYLDPRQHAAATDTQERALLDALAELGIYSRGDLEEHEAGGRFR